MRISDWSSDVCSSDLLQELDRMAFHVYETDETVTAKERPIVFITSNNEKELPDAFLRRCFFHYIKFPDRDTMAEIGELDIVEETARSEEHTSELQSLMRISYAVFCLKKKTQKETHTNTRKYNYTLGTLSNTRKITI